MNDTPPPSPCPRCGTALDAAAVDGLCPRCLAGLHFATLTDPGEAGATTPAGIPSPADLAPHFPQLEILESLGRGGMGVVYKARQKSLDRLVALKLMAPERAGDPDFAARFAREARALAALNHPHIVAVHDFGEAGGFFWLLMEYVDGVNLRELLRTRRLSPREALAIVPPVCEALQAAHDRGIVHRDIKPENLLLDRKGTVKIADFGIAKLMGTPDGPGAEHLSGETTRTAGTPAYAAPEQQEGAAADHRADLYSLGVVLYEMLTGERPQGLLVPPSRRLHLDVRIDEIVLRALERSPELRFASADEFRTRVEATLTDPPPPHPEPPPLPGRPSRFTQLPFARRRTLRRILTLLIVASTVLFCGFQRSLETSWQDGSPVLTREAWQWGFAPGVGKIPGPWLVESRDFFHRGGNVQRPAEVHLVSASGLAGLLALIGIGLFAAATGAERRAGNSLTPPDRAFLLALRCGDGGAIHWGNVARAFLLMGCTGMVMAGMASLLMHALLSSGPSPLLGMTITAPMLTVAILPALLRGSAIAPAVPPPPAVPGRSVGAAALAAVWWHALLAWVLTWRIPGLGLPEAVIGMGLALGLCGILGRRAAAAWIPSPPGARWLRGHAVMAWVLALAAWAMTAFFAHGILTDGSGWNPAPAEALTVPVIFAASLLLPLAAVALGHLAGPRTATPRSGTARNAVAIVGVLAVFGLAAGGLGLGMLLKKRENIAGGTLDVRVAAKEVSGHTMLVTLATGPHQFVFDLVPEFTGVSLFPDATITAGDASALRRGGGVILVPPGHRPLCRIGASGRTTFAFVFPDASMARAALAAMQPIGRPEVRPDRPADVTLFDFPLPDGSRCTGHFRCSTIRPDGAPPAPPTVVKELTPQSGNGFMAAEGSYPLSPAVTLVIKPVDTSAGAPGQRGVSIAIRHADGTSTMRGFTPLARGGDPFFAWHDRVTGLVWMGSPTVIGRLPVADPGGYRAWHAALAIPPELRRELPPEVLARLRPWYPAPAETP